ncbi:Pol I core factor CF [Lobulomyces angularis]|nr:Pol I core factor CF [Lobulomyces angularis]
MDKNSKNYNKKICLTCRSKKFKKAEDHFVCSNGHILVCYEIFCKLMRFAALISGNRRRAGCWEPKIKTFGETETQDYTYEDILFNEEGEQFLKSDLESIISNKSDIKKTSAFISQELFDDNDIEEHTLHEKRKKSIQEPFLTKKINELEVFMFGRHVSTELNNLDKCHLHPTYAPAIIYLACSWLRIPVLLSDVFRWIGDGTIPFFSSFTKLPRYLLDALLNESVYIYKLRRVEQQLPTLEHLKRVTIALGKFYNQNYEIKLPSPLNKPLFRIRLIVELGLPVQFYVLSKILTEMHEGFKCPDYSEADSFSAVSEHFVEKEFSLIGCSIIAVCIIVYGMDGTLRYDLESYPFLANIPKFNDWMEQLIREKKYTKGFASWSQNDFHLSESETIQKYLNFCEDELFWANGKNKGLQEAFLSLVEKRKQQKKDEKCVRKSQKRNTFKPIEREYFMGGKPVKALGEDFIGFPPKKHFQYDQFDKVGELHQSLEYLLSYLIEIGGIDRARLELVFYNFIKTLEIESLFNLDAILNNNSK